MRRMPLLTVNIPHSVTLALSGGFDSTAALRFLLAGGHDVHLLHVDHCTEHGRLARSSVLGCAKALKLPVEVYTLCDVTPKEHDWSRARKEIYDAQPRPVLVAHSLADACVWYVMKCFQGVEGPGRYVAPQSGNVIRPFLLWPQNTLRLWETGRETPPLPVRDPSNEQPRACTRNAVEHMLRTSYLPVAADPTYHVAKYYRRYISNGFSTP